MRMAAPCSRAANCAAAAGWLGRCNRPRIVHVAASRTHYDVLGLTARATEEDIRRAFRRLAKEKHPDVSQADNSEEEFMRLKAAYDTLVDGGSRALYDTHLKQLPPAPPPITFSSSSSSSTVSGTRSEPGRHQSGTASSGHASGGAGGGGGGRGSSGRDGPVGTSFRPAGPPSSSRQSGRSSSGSRGQESNKRPSPTQRPPPHDTKHSHRNHQDHHHHHRHYQHQYYQRVRAHVPAGADDWSPSAVAGGFKSSSSSNQGSRPSSPAVADTSHFWGDGGAWGSPRVSSPQPQPGAGPGTPASGDGWGGGWAAAACAEDNGGDGGHATAAESRMPYAADAAAAAAAAAGPPGGDDWTAVYANVATAAGGNIGDAGAAAAAAAADQRTSNNTMRPLASGDDWEAYSDVVLAAATPTRPPPSSSTPAAVGPVARGGVAAGCSSAASTAASSNDSVAAAVAVNSTRGVGGVCRDPAADCDTSSATSRSGSPAAATASSLYDKDPAVAASPHQLAIATTAGVPAGDDLVSFTTAITPSASVLQPPVLQPPSPVPDVSRRRPHPSFAGAASVRETADVVHLSVAGALPATPATDPAPRAAPASALTRAAEACHMAAAATAATAPNSAAGAATRTAASAAAGAVAAAPVTAAAPVCGSTVAAAVTAASAAPGHDAAGDAVQSSAGMRMAKSVTVAAGPPGLSTKPNKSPPPLAAGVAAAVVLSTSGCGRTQEPAPGATSGLESRLAPATASAPMKDLKGSSPPPSLPYNPDFQAAALAEVEGGMEDGWQRGAAAARETNWLRPPSASDPTSPSGPPSNNTGDSALATPHVDDSNRIPMQGRGSEAEEATGLAGATEQSKEEAGLLGAGCAVPAVSSGLSFSDGLEVSEGWRRSFSPIKSAGIYYDAVHGPIPGSVMGGGGGGEAGLNGDDGGGGGRRGGRVSGPGPGSIFAPSAPTAVLPGRKGVGRSIFGPPQPKKQGASRKRR